MKRALWGGALVLGAAAAALALLWMGESPSPAPREHSAARPIGRQATPEDAAGGSGAGIAAPLDPVRASVAEAAPERASNAPGGATLCSEWVLMGRVVDCWNRPAAGFGVALLAPDGDAAPVRSDGEGRFVLRGRHALSAVALQVASLSQGAGAVRRGLSLAPGTVTDLGDVEVERRPVFGLRVEDEHGMPVAGARVRWGGLQTRTSQNGRAALVDLDHEEESLHVYVSHPSHGAGDGELLPGKETIVRLTAGPWMRLRVVPAGDEGGELRVFRFLVDGDGRRGFFLDRTCDVVDQGGGFFEVRNLLAGKRYRVVAVDRASRAGWVECVAPAAGEGPLETVVSLREAARLAGSVVDAASGAPLEGARLEIACLAPDAPVQRFDAAEAWLREERSTDASGAFDFGPRPPLPHRLLARAPEHAPVAIALAPEQFSASLAVRLKRLGRLRVLVRDAERLGAVVAARRWADGDGRALVPAVRESRESFLLEGLLPGPYRVAVGLGGTPADPEGADPRLVQDVAVTGGATGEVRFDLRTVEPCVLEVRVVDREGRGCADAPVRVSGAEGLRVDGRTDAEGWVRLTLLPGRVRVDVGSPRRKGPVFRDDSLAWRTLDLYPGSVSTVTLLLAPGTLKVVVATADGNALIDALVLVRDVHERGPLLEGRFHASRTDETGTTVFPELPSGTYEVYVDEVPCGRADVLPDEVSTVTVRATSRRGGSSPP